MCDLRYCKLCNRNYRLYPCKAFTHGYGSKGCYKVLHEAQQYGLTIIRQDHRPECKEHEKMMEKARNNAGAQTPSTVATTPNTTSPVSPVSTRGSDYGDEDVGQAPLSADPNKDVPTLKCPPTPRLANKEFDKFGKAFTSKPPSLDRERGRARELLPPAHLKPQKSHTPMPGKSIRDNTFGTPSRR